MKATGMLAIVGMLGVATLGRSRPRGSKARTGPGVQAAADSKEPDILKTCKVPPPGRGGGRGPGRGAPPPAARETTVKEIPGVIAAGQKWKDIWQVSGNNADGIIGTKDGGILIAQNDNSNVVKLDKNGKTSVAYSGTNTGGSVAMNSKGALFVANRGIYPSIEELAPNRKPLANKYNGDPMDCIGVVLNDITADSKGGVYFTMGTVYHTDSKGTVTKFGENLGTNGIVLSVDEKHLYVTNGLHPRRLRRPTRRLPHQSARVRQAPSRRRRQHLRLSRPYLRNHQSRRRGHQPRWQVSRPDPHSSRRH